MKNKTNLSFETSFLKPVKLSRHINYANNFQKTLSYLYSIGVVLFFVIFTYSIQAQCDFLGTTNLTDGEGFLWDVQPNGAIKNGTIDAYDIGMSLRINGTYFPVSFQTTELAGRQIVKGPAVMSGLNVTRKVYVPASYGWARFLEIFENPTGAAISLTVRSESNPGSDSNTNITSSSSGDLLFTTADRWVATDDDDNGGDPSLNYNFWGLTASVMPSLVGNIVYDCASSDGTFAEFQITVPANSTVVLMFFAAQNSNRAVSQAKAMNLDLLPVESLFGLSGVELAPLNWNNVCTDVAQITGGASYCTLQAALDDADEGDEIVLLQDVDEMNLSITNSVILNADVHNLTARNLTIPSTKYMKWLTSTLTIPATFSITNNGTLWNNGNIIHTDPYTNAGTYKGTGTFNGNFINNGTVTPGD